MDCKIIDQLQHAFVDGELDVVNANAFAQHLASCPACATKLEALSSLKQQIKTQTTRHAVPLGLYDKISRAANNTAGMHSSKTWLPLKWGGAGAGVALAACLLFLMVMQPGQQYMLQQELITSHIRSMQDGHLTDVISTDQHTVKPWFNGRLDISPPVVNLASTGFPLIGGRLDYIDHHNAAVLVYRHNAHIINLFIWPSASSYIGAGSTAAQQGYSMRHWADKDLQFWAVSDVNPAALTDFESQYRNPTIK